MTDRTRPKLPGPVVVVLLCVAALVFDAATGLLPTTPYLTVITWQRLVIVAGLVAVLAAGARLPDFRTRLDVPILVLVVAALAVTVRSGGGAQLRNLVSFIAVYYLVTALLRVTKPAWRTVAMLASGVVTVAGAVAISQISRDVPTGFCRSGLFGDAACEPGTQVRAVGTFANPNLLAAFLLLFLPLSVLAVATIADRMYQICVLGLTLVGYIALLATFSRAAYIAGFAGLMVLTWQRARGRFSPATIRLAGWIGAGLLAAVLIGIAVVSKAGRALGVRNEAWSAAVDIALERPFGVGLGRAGAVVNARIDGTEEFVHVHNLWLNWLVETGFVGLLAITAITAGALVTAAGLAKKDVAIGFAGFAALLGFLIMNLMDHPSNLTRISVAFWMILGVAMGSAPARWRATPIPSQPAKRESRASMSGELPLPKIDSAGQATDRIEPVERTEPILPKRQARGRRDTPTPAPSTSALNARTSPSSVNWNRQN
ncbi:O-antigen ligase domain-containing protein [Kibdelosporangium aridum]|uniref:O-antigen ligase domain-containing protein n=1 Tax=Kibdelosporangium aridum TaxID=2030 RepID=A0A428ZKB0_KIBAR|nr:O-antigen ligase family protein [Kibdelosporangium aridum]RSM88494.1 O-antigen ligase domain-containing protein [Kibdelosporangium aridum]